MKRSLFALAVAAALPFSAQAASDLSYSYIEGNYINIDADDTDGDFDGWGARGSVNFGASNFYGLASYANVEFDEDDSSDDYNLDIDMFEIGVGYHHNLSDKADLIAELAYKNWQADIEGVDDFEGDEIDGFRASIGLRGALAPRFEGIAKLNYTDFDEEDSDDSSDDDSDDSDVSGTIGGQFKFNQTWGLTGEVEFAEDSTQWMVGVRASF